MVDILMHHSGMQQYACAYKTRPKHLQVASKLKKEMMTTIHKVHGTKSSD
jgi:hypothetical protein